MKRYRLGLIFGCAAALCWLGMWFGMLRFVRYAESVLVGVPHLIRESRQVDDLTYRTLDGKPLRISAVRGKVVFVNLWATWCPPCNAEMPSIEKLYAQYKSDPKVVFVLAAVRDKPDQVRTFASRHHPPLPIFLTQAGDVPASVHASLVPTTLIYAKDGTVAAEHTGRADWSGASW